MGRVNLRSTKKIDRNDKITLVRIDVETDSTGRRKKIDRAQKVVWAGVRSVPSYEFAQASLSGLKPQRLFVVSSVDYGGESEVIHEGTRFAIYRTYEASEDEVELYCERQAGAS